MSVSEKKLMTVLYYESALSQQIRLDYRCYKYDASGDSVLVASRLDYELRTNKGVGSTPLSFAPGNYHNSYYNILKKTGGIAPGRYKVMVRLRTGETVQEKTFVHQVDSNLSLTSPLRGEMNRTLTTDQGGSLQLKSNVRRKLDRTAGKIGRLFKSRGLSSTREQHGDKEYISLYHSGWFAGRYEVALTSSLKDQLHQQQTQLSGPLTSLAQTELESYRSLLSQVRELTSQKKEDKELTGEIGLTGNWGNTQPEYSQQENNYYELRGRIETKVHDLPVSIEGYYTTQDRNRPIKGSYIRIHYDADKAKEELMGLISGFKNRSSQTLSKGKGLEQVYGSYLERLEREKATTLAGLKKETGLSDLNTNLPDTAGLVRRLQERIAAGIDSSGIDSNKTLQTAQQQTARAAQVADSARRIYDRAKQQYERLVALEKQTRKYAALVEQYRNTNYFDSTLGYARLQDLEQGDATTYKQLARKASGLLPEGKAKRFATGLTNVDLGIFPKAVSRYTLAGQQLKGLDAGYDLGFCEVGGTYGTTEFAGRDGTLDKYTAYSGRVKFKPLKEQQVSLVYYGYMPSGRSLSQDTFFKNVDLALPSFRNPVHIVSAAYEGTIGQHVRLEGDIAASLQKKEDQQLKDQLSHDQLAWRVLAEGQIPKTGIQVNAGYEHGGRDFKNSTLPVTLSGTDILKLGSKGSFFRSFLTLGVEYNNIRQQSFSSSGDNSRWGFEIGTHSKRYPSVSLSYKPYTTFRSYTDTLAIPQRPIVGSVWTGRASYQWKQTGGRSWRFSATYNKSSSEIDTSRYGSNLVQLNINYSTKTWMIMGSAGNMDQTQQGGITLSAPAHMRTTFGMISASSPINAQTTVNGGGDIGVAGFGLSKYGLQGGISYRLKRQPLTARVQGRYSQYRFSSGEVWRPVYGGSIDILWQLKMKLNK